MSRGPLETKTVSSQKYRLCPKMGCTSNWHFNGWFNDDKPWMEWGTHFSDKAISPLHVTGPFFHRQNRCRSRSHATGQRPAVGNRGYFSGNNLDLRVCLEMIQMARLIGNKHDKSRNSGDTLFSSKPMKENSSKIWISGL